MRKSPGPLLRRAMVGVLAVGVFCAPARAAAPPAPEAQRLAFAERYHALQHGGIVRAANAAIRCCTPSYVDVDRDPDTYNSSRAEVRLPKGSRVTYARLYWGGNLRVGEQKPARDNGRVLVSEPGGAYKEVLADSVVGHRAARGADAFQASADVTGLVRDSRPGLYTVAQVNAAKGASAAGPWGGWTLVVAYENPAEPLRALTVWDGFDTLDARTAQEIRPRGVRVPKGATGRAGLVAYGGERGRTGDSLTVSTGHGPNTVLSDAANPRDDVLNSTITDPRTAPSRREPSYSNTLGYDSDVFDLGTALRSGGDQLTLRLVSRRDAAWAGVLFAAVDATE